MNLAMGLAAAILSTAAADATDVQILLGPNFGDFSVINYGDTVSLRSRVEVQQLVAGAWQDRGVQRLYILASCPPDFKPLPACRPIGRNETVVAIPWTGFVCHSQCQAMCAGEGKAWPGTYRYVIRSCDGKQSIASATFIVPNR